MKTSEHTLYANVQKVGAWLQNGLSRSDEDLVAKDADKLKDSTEARILLVGRAGWILWQMILRSRDGWIIPDLKQRCPQMAYQLVADLDLTRRDHKGRLQEVVKHLLDSLQGEKDGYEQMIIILTTYHLISDINGIANQALRSRVKKPFHQVRNNIGKLIDCYLQAWEDYKKVIAGDSITIDGELVNLAA